MYSYTALKTIHDQKVQEALEQQYPDMGQATRKHGLPHMFGKFLARFNHQSDQEPQQSLSGCTRKVECTAS